MSSAVKQPQISLIARIVAPLFTSMPSPHIVSTQILIASDLRAGLTASYLQKRFSLNPSVAQKGAAKAPQDTKKETPKDASKSPRQDYIAAFAQAVAQVISKDSNEKLLSHVPESLVADFSALRSELWLGDVVSSAVCLSHAAGIEAEKPGENASRSEGAIAKAVQGRQRLQNAALSSFPSADQEFAARTGLRYLSAYPLVTQGQLLGVLANYSKDAADDELLNWWALCSE